MNAVQTDRLLFSLRTTAAALLACLAAMWLPLPQASTSVLTVLIVSQPLAGMVLSKALYRIVGTIVGAVVAIATTQALYGAPELFALAASAWIALCVYVSIYLRDAPSAYGALLSGYTVALIAFPAVNAPETVFLNGLDRVAEICLGIACATLLSQTVFPRSAGRALRAAVDAALSNAANWADLTLRGRATGEGSAGEGQAGETIEVAAERRALVASIARLDALRVHATYDSAKARRSSRRIRILHGRLVSFLALSVSLHDRLEDMRAMRPERAAELGPLLGAAAGLMRADAGDEAARRTTLAGLEVALPTRAEMERDRERVTERATLLRVIDLLALRRDLDRLAGRLPPDAGTEAAIETSIDGEGDAPATLVRHRDHRLAAVSAFAAFGSILAVFAFWIGTGWASGAGAAIQVAVMVSLFAQQDDPASAASTFFAMTTAGALLAAVYLFAILPQLEGFEALALVLLPPLLLTTYAMSIPLYTLRALAFGLGLVSSIGLSPQFAPNFAAYANSTSATLFGVGSAAILLRIFRPIGVAWPIARLRDALYRTLAEAMAAGGGVSRDGFESRMLDLLTGLMARLDLRDPPQLALERGALVALRVGLNGLALRRASKDLPPAIVAELQPALDELARHFRRMARHGRARLPLARLDAALDATLREPEGDAGLLDIAAMIAALRSSLARRPEMFGVMEDRQAA